MKEFNVNLFIRKLTNIERLIINTEKALKSNNPKDYVSLLSYYKEIILLNLNYCQVRQILLKVIELNEIVIKENIKDLDCVDAFIKFLLFTHDFAEDYDERKKILNLFVYNYETTKLLKPNNSDIIFDYCKVLNKLKDELYSDDDIPDEYFPEKMSKTKKSIYKLLRENYLQAETITAFDYKTYGEFLLVSYSYFITGYDCNFPKYAINKMITIFEKHIFPNDDIWQLMPKLKDVFKELVDSLWQKQRFFKKNTIKKIYFLFNLFKNSSINNTEQLYILFLNSLLYSITAIKNNDYWKEALIYADDIFKRGQKIITENKELKEFNQIYSFIYQRYSKIFTEKDKTIKIDNNNDKHN